MSNKMASGHTSLEFTSGSNKVISGLASLEITSEELIDYPCSPCSAKGTTRQAVNYCIECQDYYCQLCTDSLHNSLPALRKHKLVDQTVPTDRCKSHLPLLIDMYCKKHDEVGCSSCMSSNHRFCREVYSISDVISSKNSFLDPSSLEKKVQLSMTELQQEKELNEYQLKQLEHSRQEAIQSVKSIHKNLEEKLVELERASIQEIEAEYIYREKQLNDYIQKLNSHLCDLNKAMNNVTTTATKTAQMFVSLKSAEKIVKNFQFKDISSQKQSEINNISFLIDPKIEEQFCLLQSFGTIEVKTLHEEEPNDEFSWQRSINCKLDREDQCCIVGCCLTSNGDLVVIDSYNKRLKLISNDRVTGYCDLPDVPVAIAPCSDMVVVAFADTLMHANIKEKPIRLCCNVSCSSVQGGVCTRGNTLYVCNGGSIVDVIEPDY